MVCGSWFHLKLVLFDVNGLLPSVGPILVLPASPFPPPPLQAVNKLAEIMNRKDMKLDHKKKGSTADLRKKEKENRKLQLELNQEKEKFNHMAIKYQKELSELQVVSITRSPLRTPMQLSTVAPLYISQEPPRLLIYLCV